MRGRRSENPLLVLSVLLAFAASARSWGHERKRVAVVFRHEGGGIRLHKFIDGALVGSQSIGPIDGRWSINGKDTTQPWFLLFTDDNGESSWGYLSSFLFADRPLSAAEVARLGSARASGIVSSPCEISSCKPSFRRGDANSDGTVDLTDAVSTLWYLFDDPIVAACPKAMDVNDDGAVEITDAV